jgi:putative chitinase
MIPVNGDFILSVAPRFSGDKNANQARIVGAISGVFSEILDNYEINTRLRIAHFMGQVTHECAGFITTEEFASGANYEGRADLGNTNAGDGRRYKGRGLIQITGRANYRYIGNLLGLPLEDNPEIAADPVTSLKIACEYWNWKKISDAADSDDLITATKRVNGGLNGLEDRRFFLQKAKNALARIEGIIVSASEGANTIVLHRGSFGDGVIKLQELLNKKGFLLSLDGDFGPATELAVMTFQKTQGLEVDGIVGQNTWAELNA